jgi:hypothetical protein
MRLAARGLHARRRLRAPVAGAAVLLCLSLATTTLSQPDQRPPVPATELRLSAVPYRIVYESLRETGGRRAFQALVERLQDRGARLTVIVGPLNEHMLVADDVAAYRRLADGASAWLRERGVATLTPAILPSDLYADLSHPLADGYAALAERLWQAGLR